MRLLLPDFEIIFNFQAISKVESNRKKVSMPKTKTASW
jgi:hypothetical protein